MQENISFWGSRYITVPIDLEKIHVKGTAHIDALAARVIKLAQKHKFEYDQKKEN